jgi:hypothetical protein
MLGTRNVAGVGSVAMAALLALAMAMTTHAAEEPQPQAQEEAPRRLSPEELPIEELEELDEVFVRGGRLRDRIVRAEDEFYKLFNQINTDDRYDTSCPYLNDPDDRTSRIQFRMCIPGFVAEAMADWAVYKAQCEPEFRNFDTNRDGRVSAIEASVNGDLAFQFEQFDEDGDGYLNQYQEFRNFENWARMNMNCYRPPPPDLVLMNGTKDWYEHTMKVINSDPRLQEMAGKLDEMHRELNMIQSRANTLEDLRRESMSSRPRNPNAGPRR